MNPTPDELAAWLRLTSTAGVAPAEWRAALGALGDPRAVLDTPSSGLTRWISREAARALRADPDAALTATIDSALRWCSGAARECITLADPRYPRALLEIPDPPGLLFAQGDLAQLDRPLLGLLTAPNPSRDGQLNARQFARALSASGIALVSPELDGAAWWEERATPRPAVLVSPGGLASPASAGTCALWLSATATPAAPLRSRRGTPDRITAGLCRALLVVEAGIGSSPLATARLAADCGRDILAIPGSIHAPLAKGCHRLIQQGAKLVETAADVLEEFARHGRGVT